MDYVIREYTEGDRSAFAEWFNRLDAVTAARIVRSIGRMEVGNFGDSKALKGGIQELPLTFGPGYRVYYGIENKTLGRITSAIQHGLHFVPHVNIAAA
ncbi:MAG: type II toxin-antitoxin system RelE/ParE family toxin [Kiritimatiellia bacterium]